MAHKQVFLPFKNERGYISCVIHVEEFEQDFRKAGFFDTMEEALESKTETRKSRVKQNDNSGDTDK